MGQIINIIKEAQKRIFEHKLTVYAAQATLFIIISALPFIMLLISLTKFFIPFEQSDIVGFMSTMFPVQIIPFITNIFEEIFSGNTIPIVSVTTITALWAASKGMMSLVQGLGSVYGTDHDRGYIKTRLFSLVYTAFFMVLIIATLLFFVAGRYLMRITAEALPLISYIVNLIYTFPIVLYMLILSFVFGVLYKLLPGGRLSFINQLPGAALAAAGWIVFTAAYTFYVNRFANYSYIYGSLTAIVLLMLWLYFCMNIFLLGAEINCLLKERKEKRIEG